jgi:type IV pilus assembly protein PilY1
LSSNAANTVMTFTYVTYSGCNPCTGATATTPGPTDTITFTRALGSTTVDALRTSSNIPNFSLGIGVSVNIADAAGNYSGPHVLTANNDGAGTFSFNDNVTLGPATPASGTISAVALGTSGGPTTANLINWMRGKDLWEDENIDGTGAFSDVRGSIHGDVLHARPVMVNYGGTVGIVGFYGSNDGYLRAIAAGSGKANEPANRTDTYTDDGSEKWAFIPSEFLSYNKLSRAYLNGTSGTSLIRYPNQACGLTTTPAGRDYRWDGPITAYQSSSERVYYTTDPAVTTDTEPVAGCSTANPATCYSRLREVYYTTNPATITYSEPAAGCSTASPATCYKRPERTWVFAAMRRGGRAIYALDASIPDTPKFMWRIDNNSTGFSDLAQTWSEPKVRTLKGIFTRADGTTTVKNPIVLIFGAGYDNEVEDQPSGTARTVTKGRGVYVVEAETGQLIRFLQPASGTLYSFPADTTPIDMDNDGYVDRIYAGDTNASIFRWDLNSATVTDINSATYWTTRHVAALGDVGHDGGSDARKIHFAPEVLPFKLSGVVKVMVLFGTGDREKPLGNLDGSSIKTLSGIGGCPAYFTGSNPYPITGSLSGTPYTYFGPRVRDQFFGVVDSGGATIVEANLQYVNLDSANLAPFDVNSTTYKGWRIRLKTDPDGSQGDTRGEEKSVNAAKVVGGVTFFATNVPVTPDTSAGVCSNLGVALGYAVDPFTGMPAINRDNSVSGGAATYTQADYATTFSGGGLPPTVTSGVVTVGGTPYRFIIGSGGSGVTSASAVGGERNILNLKGTRSRLYWSYGADN